MHNCSLSSPPADDHLNHSLRSNPQRQPPPNTQHIIHRGLSFVLSINFPIPLCCATKNTKILSSTFAHRILSTTSRPRQILAPSNPLILSPSPYIRCRNCLSINSDEPPQSSFVQQFYSCLTVHTALISNHDILRHRLSAHLLLMTLTQTKVLLSINYS